MYKYCQRKTYLHFELMYNYTGNTHVRKQISKSLKKKRGCCLKPSEQYFQIYHGVSMRWCSHTLYYINHLTWILTGLTYWNNSPWRDMSLHSVTLSCFQATQTLILLPNAACWAEKSQIPILYVISLTLLGIVSTIY